MDITLHRVEFIEQNQSGVNKTPPVQITPLSPTEEGARQLIHCLGEPGPALVHK